MKVDKMGIEIIKRFEAFRSKPYRCPAGVPTIGYGTTHYPDGRAVRMGDNSISKLYAENILIEEVNRDYARKVDHYIQSRTTQDQFNALVSFAYNLGTGALKGSTLLRKHNAANYVGAAKEFKKWVHAGGKTLKGLVRRRKLERKLYMV